MALAPKGDPRRPLQLAIRSSRLLGIVFTVLGLLVMLFASRALLFRGTLRVPNIRLVVVAMVYLGPGIMYLLFSIFLGKRQPWAIIASMIVAGLHGVLAILACVSAIVMILNLAAANRDASVPAFIVLAVCVLWLAAMAQLIYHLSKSFESIKVDPDGGPRGFEPLAPNTLRPLPLLPPDESM